MRRWYNLFGCVLIILSLCVFIFSYSVNQRVEPSVVFITAEYKQLVPLGLFTLEINKSSKSLPKPLLKPPLKEEIMNSSGTGFAMNGRIITCYHVVQNAFHITVITGNNQTQEAKLERVNKDTDLAELSIAHCPRSLILSQRLPIAQEKIWQFGHPMGMRSILTSGIFLFYNTDSKQNIVLLDTYFGNSGSPVFNSCREVIGMTHTLYQGTRFTGVGTLQDLRNFISPNNPR